MKKKIALALSTLLLGAYGAEAKPDLLKRHGDWGVYTYRNGGHKVCYLLTVPMKEWPAGVDHGRNFFIVGPGPKQGPAHEPQAQMGYDLKSGSRVKVEIGDKAFWLFTKDRSAWMQNESREPEMMGAMRNGQTMTVEAVSRRGTETRYVYSLKGLSAALKQAARCK